MSKKLESERVHKCPACNGTGSIGIPGTPCGFCGQTGRLTPVALRSLDDIARIVETDPMATVPSEPALSADVPLHESKDARRWAREFVEMHGGDEGLMITWFANAIEAGRGFASPFALSADDEAYEG